MCMGNHWKKLREVAKTTALSPHYVRGFLKSEEFPVDIEELCKLLKVELALLQDGCSYLAAFKCVEDRAVIWFHEGLSVDRVRFVLAHELGHLLLHSHLSQTTDLEFGGNQDDREANRFAMDLLIPSHALNRFTRSPDLNVESIASYFGVSEGLIRTRILEEAGQIPRRGSFHDRSFSTNLTPDVMEEIVDFEEIDDD